jgi:hypothetical protein
VPGGAPRRPRSLSKLKKRVYELEVQNKRLLGKIPKDALDDEDKPVGVLGKIRRASLSLVGGGGGGGSGDPLAGAQDHSQNPPARRGSITKAVAGVAGGSRSTMRRASARLAGFVLGSASVPNVNVPNESKPLDDPVSV